MIVDIDHAAVGSFQFSVCREEADTSEKLSPGTFYFNLSEGWSVSNVHPDVVALAIIICVHPFVSDRVKVNLGVSSAFLAACKQFVPYECVFDSVSDDLKPRSKGRIPGLSFSGGVDSTAALALMPESTKLYFLDRFDSNGNTPTGLYDKHSAYVACDLVEKMGYDVRKVPTNIEYIRNPVGFSIDWTSGVPALLMADDDDLSSISWGVVAESGYRVGHEKYLDFKIRTIYRRWDSLLRAVGLCLGAPVGGVCEVGTSKIVHTSIFESVAQSCIRGPKGKPCLKCFKCFRKTLLDSALKGEAMSGSTFDHLIKFRGWEKIVLDRPIKHENVFTWIVARLKVEGESKYWAAFKERILANESSSDWSESWYPGGEELIPEEFRHHAVAKISEYLDVQDDKAAEAFRQWDIAAIKEWPGHEAFSMVMKA